MKPKPRFDLPQGTFGLMILRTAVRGPIHRYAFAQRIRQLSRHAPQVRQGSLYPAPHRLECEKFIDSKRAESGRQAKFCRHTAKERAQLNSETESWHSLTDVVGRILRAPKGELA